MRLTKIELSPLTEVVRPLTNLINLEPLSVASVEFVAGRVAAGREVGQHWTNEMGPLNQKTKKKKKKNQNFFF